ncbi:MAG TPA: glycosyltransferase [Chryseolinea sp.]|nr:glycosyltransferase [Chryseolinea sp.]
MPTLLDFLLVLFFVTIGVQIVYQLIFVIGLSRKDNTTEPQLLPVSVIVCAHDEEQNLKVLIPALLEQDHSLFEVIIVNDRSNDATFDMLLAEASRDHRLRMVHVNRTPPHVDNKKYALTLGIKAARYEWILLTDADCVPTSKSWISSMSAAFNDQTNFVLGYSPYQKLPGLLNKIVRFEALVTAIQYLSFALLKMPYMGVGRNLAYRRSKFLEGKGFNNILKITGGDDDLYVNQNATNKDTAVCLEAGAQMTSVPKLTWREYNRQKIRHLSVGKRYKTGHKIVLGAFHATWILSWILGVLLLPLHDNWALIAGLLVFRIIGWMFTCSKACQRLSGKFELWLLPLLDFIYAFYYLVAGLRALATKRIQWKN